MRRSRAFLVAFVANYLTLALGTAALEGWSVLDGLYYATICLTTVGFGDFVPASTAGRVLALVLIPVGIVQVFAIGFMAIQEVVRQVVTRRGQSMVESELSGHYIVCGYGKIGKVVVETLRHQQKPVCVVEKDPAQLPRLESLGISYVIGDVLELPVLRQAGLDRAACVVATLDNDAHNVYLVLEIRDVLPALTIVATASTADAARRVKLAGASRVVSPPALAGEMLAKSALNLDVIDFVTVATDLRDTGASIGQIAVHEHSWVAGHTLAEIGKEAPGALVVMVKEGEKVTMPPQGSTRIDPGMILVVVGRADAIRALSSMERPPASV